MQNQLRGDQGEGCCGWFLFPTEPVTFHDICLHHSNHDFRLLSSSHDRLWLAFCFPLLREVMIT